jgi:hypothetical protein
MESQDYPIHHFEKMRALATMLAALPAQVLEHVYSFDSFGSWTMIVRCKGRLLRLVFDGRDGEYFLEQSASHERPYVWDQPPWRMRAVGGEDIVPDLVRLIERAGAGNWP